MGLIFLQKRPQRVSVPILSHVWLCVTPWTVACHVPLSMEFSKQQNWTGLAFPTSGDLPDSGIEHTSPALAGRFFTTKKNQEGPQFSSVQSLSRVLLFVISVSQFSHSVVSDSLWPHKPQHARPPCPSPTPRVHPNPCPLCRWCHPTISSSIIPFSSCPQSFPASRSFQMSQLSASGGQCIGVSAQHQLLQWTSRTDVLYSGLVGSLCSPRDTLKSLLQHHSSKASILQCSAFFIVQLSYPYMTTGKTIALTRQIFVGKVMSLLFNMLSWLVITFLPRSKCLLISWLQSPSAVILEPSKIKSATVSTVSPSICHEVMGPDAISLWSHQIANLPVSWSWIFELPELSETHFFVVYKPPTLWYFVIAA